MEDIEIAKKVDLKPISQVAKEIGLEENEINLYGKWKAKISLDVQNRLKEKKKGNLVLVTAINPTPLGEGKTTISIGLADGLRKIGEKSILALREPSLGPVFGIKGGATGGGYAQVAPMEDINLHFTGDIHAITAANNLLAAMIDNHIFQGNDLDIKEVTWKRCMDLNDRQLRKVEVGLSGEKNMVPREDGFDITVASEIMAILCLAKDREDLKRRLGNIIIGYNEEGNPVKAKDLKVEGAMAVLLKDAIEPNLVQTLEHTPAIIHGGPFANIAHGCNSIIATKLGMSLADFCVTEAGFGADLGAEKFLDIKCRKAGIRPNVVVIVATLKALKYHGGAEKEHIQEENKEALAQGMKNLMKHIHNMQNVYHLPVIVAINRYSSDTKEEIEYLENSIKEQTREEVQVSLVEAWEKGGEGATDLARKVAKLCKDQSEASSLDYCYELEEAIEEKIEKIATKIYGAEKVEYTKEAINQMNKIKELGYGNLPVCIAKTQNSLSDDPKNITDQTPYTIHVKEVLLKAGAEFIVAITGKIMTMPGLPKHPAAENITLDERGNVIGIF